jgi:hypothetical protein
LFTQNVTDEEAALVAETPPAIAVTSKPAEKYASDLVFMFPPKKD